MCLYKSFTSFKIPFPILLRVTSISLTLTLLLPRSPVKGQGRSIHIRILWRIQDFLEVGGGGDIEVRGARDPPINIVEVAVGYRLSLTASEIE